jgi:hypothetical protein
VHNIIRAVGFLTPEGRDVLLGLWLRPFWGGVVVPVVLLLSPFGGGLGQVLVLSFLGGGVVVRFAPVGG